MWLTVPMVARPSNRQQCRTLIAMQIPDQLAGRHILLVEDEVLIGMEMIYELETAGAFVTHVLTLEAALKALDQPWSAAVLDINLRGREVYPVADRLQEMGVPFLFCSGHGSRLETSTRYPRSMLLAKPVDETKLLASLAELLAGSQDRTRI
ncbi:response regulator [Aurantimonas sp. VKM B-3413]|uniref:response regulator n=1 Tax=Aurantimonas sp. VKM B-3413 TaxID=2779401 RepID=UPI001E64A8F1|nr:response regulator [Aurantimonas sp. VKM B-3413]MCB8837557.1 response regulator [Aurantimonas sp. VKM B-3413]